MSALPVCSSCPHANGCSKVSKCLYELAADDYDKKYNSPRFMTPGQANNVIRKMRGGMTLKHLHQANESGLAIVSASKLRKHCATYPEYGAEVLSLAAINRAASDKRKSGHKRALTKCKHGHSLSGDNLGFKTWRTFTTRYCKTCAIERQKRGFEMKPDVLKQVKGLVKLGHAISSFTKSGSDDYLLGYSTFKRYCRENPVFDKLVADNMKVANSRG